MIVEKVFLGTLMKENYLITDTVVRPEHLQDSQHRGLYQEMMGLKKAGKNIDYLTFTTIPHIKDYGGLSYLAELQSFASIEQFEEAEELILSAWKEREKKNILTMAVTNNWEIEEVFQRLEQINQTKVDDCYPITSCLVDMYDAPWSESEAMGGVPSGIQKLDEMTNGWQSGEVTIIAARPSMGKTDVMLHFAKEAGWAGYLPIIFSLEMPHKLLTSRLIASTGNFNRQKLRNPSKWLKPKQKEKWAQVLTEVNETNLYIFDRSAQTIPEMRAKIRKVIHQNLDKKPIIFIDYLTLIQANESYGGNGHYQVSEISRNLKTIAKEFDCPLICLAQLNRSVETRANNRPMMSDIRESGSVEQDADVILFLYREKYYDQEVVEDTLELIVSKNRNGPVGKVTVSYNPFTGRIGRDV